MKPIEVTKLSTTQDKYLDDIEKMRCPNGAWLRPVWRSGPISKIALEAGKNKEVTLKPSLYLVAASYYPLYIDELGANGPRPKPRR